MLKKLTLLTSFLLLLLTACIQKTKKNDKSFQHLVTDTSISHRAYTELDFSRRMDSMLNLDQIDNGVDSFELRIWVTSMIFPQDLIILKFVQDKWVTYKYRFYPNEKVIDSMNVYNIPTPKEIDKIVFYLKQKEFLRLPSQYAILNFEDNVGDGQICTIEVATRNFYKLLQYHCPEHYSNEPNNLKFMNLIKFLNQYFTFYKPWCKSGA